MRRKVFGQYVNPAIALWVESAILHILDGNQSMFAVRSKRPALEGEARLELDEATQGTGLPAFRDRAEGGIDAGDFFVAGEAEVGEPLAIQGAGHLLQDADALLTVLHQLVVGRQDARDPA